MLKITYNIRKIKLSLRYKIKIPYVRHYCPLSNHKPHPPKNKLFFIFYCIFEQKFPHKKSKKQIEAADNRAAGTVHNLIK